MEISQNNEQLRQLKQNEPTEFITLFEQEKDSFVFGIEDCGAIYGAEEEGNFVILIDRKIEIEMVSHLHGVYKNLADLPQFTIFPDDQRAGENHVQILHDEEFEQSYKGLIFFVSTERFRRLAVECKEIIRKYGKFDRIPDRWFAETELIDILKNRILKEKLVLESGVPLCM